MLKNPANRHKAVGFTLEQWHYAFTNTLQRGGVPRAVRALPHPRVRADLLGQRAGQHPPGHDDTWVDYHNDDRAPLLFISGSDDHLMPPKIQRSNAKHYKSDTITEVKEFEGPHLLPARTGWEEVADYALDWALSHADGRPAASRVTRRPHHAHRRADHADRGRRLAAADRPDVRPPRPRYPFGWGTGSRKLAGPSIAAGRRRPIDAVLLTP